MDVIEAVVRWAGAAAVTALLGFILAGLWRARRQPRGRGSGPGQRISALPFWVYLLMTVGYLGLCAALWWPLPLTLATPLRAVALAAGGLLLFPGLALVLWARVTLGEMYGVSSSLGTQLYAGHRLVTRGPFSIVRHPMYLGFLVGALGGILVYRTWTPIFLAVNFLGFIFRARREEQALGAELGEEWAEYCRRVPAWIPRLWAGGPKSPKNG